MSTSEITAAPQTAVAITAEDLPAMFLRGRKASTWRTYSQGLKAFGEFVGLDPKEAASALLSAGAGQANVVGHQYRAKLLEDGLSPATVNLRLATLRALVAMARSFGLVNWSLETPNVPRQAYRDTAGPGTDAFSKMLAVASSARDSAILRLLFDVALRRGEVESLDMEHVELHGATASLWILGKGKHERTRLTLPTVTADAVREWMAERGQIPGPLFLNRSGGRLTTTSIFRMVSTTARRAGIEGPVSPHKLRHSAITRAATILGGDMVAVQKFSRHADIRTAAIYVDRANDDAGAIASAVAAASTCQACGRDVARGEYICGTCK